MNVIKRKPLILNRLQAKLVWADKMLWSKSINDRNFLLRKEFFSMSGIAKYYLSRSILLLSGPLHPWRMWRKLPTNVTLNPTQWSSKFYLKNLVQASFKDELEHLKWKFLLIKVKLVHKRLEYLENASRSSSLTLIMQ